MRLWCMWQKWSCWTIFCYGIQCTIWAQFCHQTRRVSENAIEQQITMPFTENSSSWFCCLHKNKCTENKQTDLAMHKNDDQPWNNKQIQNGKNDRFVSLSVSVRKIPSFLAVIWLACEMATEQMDQPLVWRPHTWATRTRTPRPISSSFTFRARRACAYYKLMNFFIKCTILNKPIRPI